MDETINETTETVDTPTETLTSETQVDDKNITVNVVVPAAETPAAGNEDTEMPVSDGAEVVEENPAVTTVTTTTLDTLAPPSDSSLAAMVQGVFGDYTPRTQTVTVIGSDGSTATYTECVPGLAGLDWYWIAGVALFAAVLVSFFKMVGVLLKR